MLNGNPLVKLVGYLKAENIIPLKLAELIFKENDINAADEDGNTALFHAIEKNHLNAIKRLLANGAKNTLNENSSTPFLYAIRHAYSTVIKYFLDQNNLPASFLPQDLLATDQLNRNAFHIAAAAPDLVATKLLLADERFEPIRRKKDLYGHTPFDVAIIHKQDKIAEALSGQPLAEIPRNPNYGKKPLNIVQDVLNEQLAKYLSLLGRQGNLIIPNEGNCNGWVFIFFLYVSLGQSNIFNELLTAIASWDGTQEGLMNGALPASLKRKFPFTTAQEFFNFYLNKQGPFKSLWESRGENPEIIAFFSQFKNPRDLRNFLIDQHRKKTPCFKNLCIDFFERYNSLGDLFEQTANDLSLFQFDSPAVNNLQLSWNQEWRIQQYQLMQSAYSSRKLVSLYNFNKLQLNQKQLAEYLSLFAEQPNTFIDIGGAKHATALFITPEGKLHYYDPNFRHKVIPFDSPQALADHMFKFMFTEGGYIKNGKITIDFFGYQFIEQQEVDQEQVVIPRFSSNISKPHASANGFTPLHEAIMRNDMKLRGALLELDPENLYATDGHGNTPFRMAIQMQNGKCLAKLIDAAKKAKLDLKRVVGRIDFKELRNLHPTHIEHLFSRGVLTPVSTDINRKTLLHCEIGYQTKSLAKKVMTHPEWNVNRKDSYGKTPLMSAVRFSKEVMFLLLNDPKIDPHLADNKGRIALMHCLMYKSCHTNEFLLMLKNKKLLTAGINLKDKNDKTAVFFAIINHAEPLTLQYLFSHGAKVNLVDDKDKSPLVYALENNISLPLMKTLLHVKSLNINNPNKTGQSPLMQGILFKTRTELLSLLIDDSRIQVNNSDQLGLTALMHALKMKTDKQFILKLIDHPQLNIRIKDKAGKSVLKYAEEHFPDKDIIHAIRAREIQENKKHEWQNVIESVECRFSNLSIMNGLRATKGTVPARASRVLSNRRKK